MPVTLAGGLTRPTSPTRCATIPAVGVDVASGVEAPREPGRAPDQGPAPGRAVREARARPPATTARTSPFGPTPVHAGLLEADGAGPLGHGARLRRPLRARDADGAPSSSSRRPTTRSATTRVFWAELRELLGRFAGRPTALYRADRLADGRRGRGRAARRAEPRPPASRRIRLYLKREDLAHTGAHKINNALGQALLTRRLGKTRVIAETGAGQHGVATATACALLDLPCVVYMGAEDIERQGPNVLRMRALGAEVRSVTSGTATLKDAVNEAMRDWVTNVETTHYVLGSAMGPHPYPTIVRDLQRRIGDEAAAQLHRRRGAAAGPRARLRRRRLERHRAARPVHRRADRPAGGRRGGRRRHGRPAGTPRRSSAARRASSTARAR